jgi:hypothetical protein
LYCRCRGLNEKIRRQDYLENLYGDAHLDAPPPPPPPTHNHHHQQQQQGGVGSLEATV